MARYKMEDGTVLDTSNARRSWKEERDWDGKNHIGRSSGSQWSSQVLYCSRKGRYYVETTSSYQGQLPRAEWVSPEAAAAFLLLNEHETPADLAAVVDSITE